MSIPEHKIEEVLARVDLLGLVAPTWSSRSRRSYEAAAPSTRRRASFYVTPEMLAKCFGVPGRR